MPLEMKDIISPEGAAGGTALGLLLWRLYLRVKGDLRVDRAADAEANFRSELQKVNKELTERIDKMAHERNAALAAKAQAEADLKIAKRDLKQALDELKDAEGTLDRLGARLEAATSACANPKACHLRKPEHQGEGHG